MTIFIKSTLIAVCFLFGTFLVGQVDQYEQDILEIFKTQEEAWNAGDIPAFMETYWRSDSLTFLGQSGPVYGWDATLDRYYKRYPDRQAMGILRFEISRIDQRSDDVCSVIGSYHLTREGLDNLEGYFLILTQRIDGRWVIVADSTH